MSKTSAAQFLAGGTETHCMQHIYVCNVGSSPSKKGSSSPKADCRGFLEPCHTPDHCPGKRKSRRHAPHAHRPSCLSTHPGLPDIAKPLPGDDYSLSHSQTTHPPTHPYVCVITVLVKYITAKAMQGCVHPSTQAKREWLVSWDGSHDCWFVWRVARPTQRHLTSTALAQHQA
jgi:hypothetical protein